MLLERRIIVRPKNKLNRLDESLVKREKKIPLPYPIEIKETVT
jgi:hypothetical protein